MGTTSFTQLKVWEKAHQTTLAIYRMTRGFPPDERFGLTHQTRKAAVSIPANIAEGFGRRPGKDRARFYTIAKGSTEELRYYLRLAKDLGHVGKVSELDDSLDEIGAMLYAVWNCEARKGGTP
jgi:four helix bundle protein